MRKFITLLIVAFVITCCNNDNETKPKDTGIIGTWRLTESFYGNADWNPVKNGYIQTFKSDGTFTSTQFTGCNTGTYKLENATLTMIYVCSDLTIKGGNFIGNYKIENGKLYLTPNDLVCYEGCTSKFSKIK